MSLVINSNIASLNSQRQLVRSGMDLDNAMERLSSGKRINSAADDAAGLAISNRQTSTVRGLDRAVANANDGISLIQTAEGALDETTNILQRMRELSIQSANGIYADTDRATLDAEMQQLKAEVDRIAETTAFNGQTILDGSLGAVALQVGSNANETISFSIGELDANSLGGVASGDVTGAEVTNFAALQTVDDGAGATTLTINGQSAGDLTGTANLGEALDTINSNVSGVETTAFVELVAGADGDGVIRGTNEMILTVTGQDGTENVIEITDTGSMEELVNKINDRAGSYLQASLNDDGRLVLSSDSSESIQITETGAGTALSASGIAPATQNFQLSFKITDGSDNADIALGADIDGAVLGLDARTDSDITGILLLDGNTADITAGDLKINGVEIGAIADGTNATGQGAAVAAAINLLSDEHGVVATNTAGVLTLNSVAGTEIKIEMEGTATALTTGLNVTNNSSSQGSTVADLNLSTQAGAQSAISIIDTALEQINSSRSELGAINNRLDFTVSNLMNVSENTAAARSRIVDADYAAETANLSRAQVLQQAASAMLAQANAAPQQVLSLLR
jgi:flagellin